MKELSDQIRLLDASELEEALGLVWEVFQEFEAPEYSEEGVREFRGFIEPEAMRQRLENKEFLIWGCFRHSRMIGVIASRPPCHISLLFVDKHFHRQGIAKALFNEMISYYRSYSEYTEVTVNSSPYAVDAYHRMGFTDATAEQELNGIRFLPMKRSLA